MAAVVALPVAAQEQDLTVLPPAQNGYQPQTTEWGEPDFRGGWPIDHLNGRTPLQRDPQYGNRIYLTEEELAQRAEQANASAERYAEEEKQGKIGMGHWVESDVSGAQTALLVSNNGKLPAFTEYGQEMYTKGRSSWNQHPFDCSMKSTFSLYGITTPPPLGMASSASGRSSSVSLLSTGICFELT